MCGVGRIIMTLVDIHSPFTVAQGHLTAIIGRGDIKEHKDGGSSECLYNFSVNRQHEQARDANVSFYFILLEDILKPSVFVPVTTS